ncbi:MAG: DUF805 domain-containing protein [Fluviicola sp.]|nr:DUF805 domain-containing protein [Fluviicola sp.]
MRKILSAFINGLSMAFNFKGETSRFDFWSFYFIYFITIIPLTILCTILDSQIIAFIYITIMYIPSISIGFRRMHDVNQSGWLFLVPIVNIILSCRAKEDNSHITLNVETD